MYKTTVTCLAFFIFLFSFFICSCDYGKIGNADRTDTYYPEDDVFEERLGFLSGLWYSHDPKIEQRLLDSYRIRKWSNLTAADKEKAQVLFPSLNTASPKTYSTKDTPKNSDYVLLFDDTVYGQDDTDSEKNENWGFCYMGVVRAINIFNENEKRGTIIIEYFEGADPVWLSDIDNSAYQGLEPGEKPFYGIYFKVINQNTIQMANPVNLAALNEREPYYTERKTLPQAIEYFNVENEAEFISWGVVIPFNRDAQ